MNRNETVIELSPIVLKGLLARLERVADITDYSETVTLKIMGEHDCFDYEITSKYTDSGASY